MLVRHNDKRTSRNTRKSRGYEAKTEQKKTLSEWLTSGTTTRKLREILPYDFQINRGRSQKFMMSCGIAVWFDTETTDSGRKFIPGSVNVYQTSNGMCYINAVMDAFEVGRVTPANVYDFLSHGLTGNLSIVGDVIYPNINKTSWGHSMNVVKNLDSRDDMTVEECASYISRKVDEIVEDLGAEVKKAMREYPDYDFKYDPSNVSRTDDGMANPYVSFPECSKASDLIMGISVAAHAACDEANRMYNGKDIFGGSYTVECSDIDRAAKKIAEYLKPMDGNMHDATKEQALFKETVDNEEKVYAELLNLFNGIARLDKSLNSFLGSRFDRDVTLSLSEEDIEEMISDYSISDAVDNIKVEMKNFNLMKDCIKEFLEASKALYDSDYSMKINDDIEPLSDTPLEEFTTSDSLHQTYHVVFPKFSDISVND